MLRAISEWRINDHDCGRLASRQHIIANRDFVSDQGFSDALVNTFVPATNQNELLARGEFRCQRLVESSSLRRKQDDSSPLGKVLAAAGSGQRFNCCKDRFGFEHHAIAAAKRPIVDHVMLVRCPGPQIMGLDRYQFRRSRPTNNSVIKHFAKKARKDSDDIDAKHGD
jgi:hypothetical protein